MPPSNAATQQALPALPDEVWHRVLQSVTLETLALSGWQRGVVFPSVLHATTNLTRVALDSCGLQELPAALSALTRLRELHAPGNSITAVPVWLCSLTHLRVLNLGRQLYGGGGLGVFDLPEQLTALRGLDAFWLTTSATNAGAMQLTIATAAGHAQQRAVWAWPPGADMVFVLQGAPRALDGAPLAVALLPRMQAVLDVLRATMNRENAPSFPMRYSWMDDCD